MLNISRNLSNTIKTFVMFGARTHCINTQGSNETIFQQISRVISHTSYILSTNLFLFTETCIFEGKAVPGVVSNMLSANEGVPSCWGQKEKIDTKQLLHKITAVWNAAEKNKQTSGSDSKWSTSKWFLILSVTQMSSVAPFVLGDQTKKNK